MSTDKKNALLLVGSPRGAKSTSGALGRYLLGQLEKHDYEPSVQYIKSRLSDEDNRALLTAVAQADLLIFAFPLYVDSLPAPVIGALSRIARNDRIGRNQGQNRQRVCAIVNCGFPESHQCLPAVAVCRRFAAQTGRQWVGGLTLGAGGALGGNLEAMGGMTRHVLQALQQAAMELGNGQSLSNATQTLFAKKLMPYSLYRMAGDYGWRKAAKGYGVAGQLNRRPYGEE